MFVTEICDNRRPIISELATGYILGSLSLTMHIHTSIFNCSLMHNRTVLCYYSTSPAFSPLNRLTLARPTPWTGQN